MNILENNEITKWVLILNEFIIFILSAFFTLYLRVQVIADDL